MIRITFTPFYSPTTKHYRTVRFMNRLWVLIQLLFILFLLFYHSFDVFVKDGIVDIYFMPAQWWVYAIILVAMPTILSIVNTKILRRGWELLMMLKFGTDNENDIAINEFLDRKAIVEKNRRRNLRRQKRLERLQNKIEEKRYLDISRKEEKEKKEKEKQRKAIEADRSREQRDVEAAFKRRSAEIEKSIQDAFDAEYAMASEDQKDDMKFVANLKLKCMKPFAGDLKMSMRTFYWNSFNRLRIIDEKDLDREGADANRYDNTLYKKESEELAARVKENFEFGMFKRPEKDRKNPAVILEEKKKAAEVHYRCLNYHRLVYWDKDTVVVVDARNLNLIDSFAYTKLKVKTIY